MRIRTDGEYSHREDTIEDAARAWDCNKTRAVLLSCELATWTLRELPQLLEDDRIPPEVARDILDDLDGRFLETSYDGPSVAIDANE